MIRAFVILALGLLTSPVAMAESFLPVYQSGSARLVEDLVIEGDDEGEFLYRGPLAVDAAGDIFVLDHRIKCIKKFSPKGEWLSTFSREGEGPGEMRQPFFICIAPASDLFVYDWGNHRVTEFDNEGAYVESISLAAMGFNILSGLAVRADGGFIASVVDYTRNYREGFTIAELGSYSTEMVRETVLDSARVYQMQNIAHGDGEIVVTAPFYDNLLWGLLPSQHVVTLWTGDYHMKLYAPDGKLLTERDHTNERLPVTDADREEYLEDFDAEIRDDIKFPKYKPYAASLNIDHEGYILVETYEADGEDAVFDVFGPNLEFISRITLPSLWRAVFAGGYIYDWRPINDGEFFHLYRYRLVADDGGDTGM